MESILCSGPISPCFLSTEKLRFLFEPVQLYLQLANLLIQLRDKILSLPVLFAATIREDPGKFLQELLPPLTNLIPVNSSLTAQLGYRLFPFHGLQRHPGLKGCPVSFSHVLNHTIPPSRLWQAHMHLISLSSFWGVLYSFPDAYSIFMAPYISPQAAEICLKDGVGYIDFAGNSYLSFGQVYIEQTGRPNPFKTKRDLTSLYSPKAARVLRVLMNY